MGPKDTLLTTKEFASRSGRTVDQVTRMLRENKLEGHKTSGRWMIPVDELKAMESASPQAPAKAKPGKAASGAPAGHAVLSVAEFSARTYLTDAGVIQWLRDGRLQGRQTSGGEWQIDAASLDLPGIQHLLRR